MRHPERIGKYVIVEKIGRGAMGDVYKAHDPVLDRHVAIKTISADLGSDDTLRLRFEREAQAAARLSHPNVITVYDFGQEQDLLYMSMELLEGADLRQAIGGRSLGDLDRRLAVMEQICEGLEAAHGAGIIHRDLKPANIRVQPNGQVKVMDFGLARLTGSEMTRTGMVMGTPHYMSPEQVRGERVDARSDIFALGCVFYEILTYHKPFDADSMHAVLFKVMQEPPTPLIELAPDVPIVLAQFLNKALAKEAALRFQTATELKRALARVRKAIAAGQGGSPIAEFAVPAAGAAPVASAAPGPESAWAGPSASVTALRGGPRPRSRTAWVVAGGVLGVVVLGLAWALRPGSAPPAPPAARPAEIDTLAQAVVGTQVELARKRLDAGDYRQASEAAGRALKLDPGNEEAKQIAADAQRILTGIDDASDALRTAEAAGDAAAAGEALWQILSLDPDNPVAADAATHLESVLAAHASEAREAAVQARRAAEQAGARRVPEFAEAVRRFDDARQATDAGRHASAARAFLLARDGFVRARREVE